MREPLDDFTSAICFDPRHVGDYKFYADIDSWYDRFENAIEDSEMVLKFDPTTPNVSCNVGIAHYALGDDAEGRQVFNICHQKVPNPHAWVIRSRSTECALYTAAERKW